MNRQASIIFLAAFLLVGLFTVPTIATQTTGFGGQASWNQMRVDLTQYTADSLSGNAVLVYNSTTGMLELDDGYSTGVGTDVLVAIDAAATAGYLGAASSDGVLRTGGGLSYTDGGDFVTIDNTQQVKVDVAATAGYIGAASNDGVLRTGSGLTYTDGGNFVTLDSAQQVKIDAVATGGYLGAASNDGVLRTGSGLTYTDGGDFVTINTDVSDGTAAGQMLHWVVGTGTWDETEVTELFWDDTNKGLGVGPNAAADLAQSYFAVDDDTLTTTTSYVGINSQIVKTAGVTDGSDNIFAGQCLAEMNHNGGTIGSLRGLAFNATLTDGTTGPIYGVTGDAKVTTGNASEVNAMYGNCDIDGGTITTDVVGVQGAVDWDGGSADNSFGGSFTTSYAAGGSITTDVYGIFSNINTASGVTLGGNIFGQQTEIDNNVAVTTSILGEQNNVTTATGAVGVDVVGSENNVTHTSGTVTGDLYGLKVSMDQNGGSATDAYGLYVLADYDGTVTDTYGVYLDESTGVDYGYYQSGTAINHLEGTYESPFVALTLGTTNGDNDNQVVAAGQNFRITNATGNFNIGGLTTPNDGRQIYIYNTTAHNMTIEEAEIAEGGGFSPISTHGGGDLATTGAGCVTLVYSSSDSTWLLIDVQV